MSIKAQAYLNHGNWVVDCPYPDCSSALPLRDGLTSARCGYPYTHPDIPAPLPGGCGREYMVVWPGGRDFTDEHRRALAERPERNRNWYPAGHPVGDAMGWSAQSADDIRAETRVHAPELGTLPIPDEDAEAIDRILRKHGLALSADLKHVKER